MSSSSHDPEQKRTPGPSQYVRLEADLVAPNSEGTVWMVQPSKAASGGILVLVAEADPVLRDRVMLGLAEWLDPDTGVIGFRVETVASGEEALIRLRGGDVAILICGRLAPLDDGRTLYEMLRDEPVFRVRSSLFVIEGWENPAGTSLHEPVHALRLCEAMARLLNQKPP